MYIEDIANKVLKTTSIVKIKYDCCKKERSMKWVDANKNFIKNNGNHYCRPCWLKSDKNPAKNKETIIKIKKTNLKRYGVSCSMNQPHLIDERREFFEDENLVNEWNEKRKQTSLEKYGTEHPTQSEEVKEKHKQTMLENWGVENPQQCEIIQEKTKKTNLKKYGVENPAQNAEIIKKAQDTTEERYGVRHYNQLPEMREYLRNHCKEWLKDSYANPWQLGLIRPEEWNEKARETVKRKILEGTWNGGYSSNYKGKFPAWKCKKENPIFRSMLEAKFHFFLNHNPFVESYDYEGLAIPYVKLDNTKHNYFIDFQVKYLNDPIIHNYEVKALINKDNEDVLLKCNAAVEYCNQNNMTYTMLYDNDINKLKITNEIVKKFISN